MARYRCLGLLLALFSLTACTVWREHTVTKWADATGGEGLERSFWREVKDKNWRELEKHLAGNYTATTPHGRLDRAQALQHFQQLQIKDFSLAETEEQLNSNTLVVTYSLTLQGSGPSDPLPAGPLRAMSVWQQQKSGWVVIAQSIGFSR